MRPHVLPHSFHVSVQAHCHDSQPLAAVALLQLGGGWEAAGADAAPAAGGKRRREWDRSLGGTCECRQITPEHTASSGTQHYSVFPSNKTTLEPALGQLARWRRPRAAPGRARRQREAPPPAPSQTPAPLCLAGSKGVRLGTAELQGHVPSHSVLAAYTSGLTLELPACRLGASEQLASDSRGRTDSTTLTQRGALGAVDVCASHAWRLSQKKMHPSTAPLRPQGKSADRAAAAGGGGGGGGGGTQPALHRVCCPATPHAQPRLGRRYNAAPKAWLHGQCSACALGPSPTQGGRGCRPVDCAAVIKEALNLWWALRLPMQLPPVARLR